MKEKYGKYLEVNYLVTRKCPERRPMWKMNFGGSEMKKNVIAPAAINALKEALTAVYWYNVGFA